MAYAELFIDQGTTFETTLDLVQDDGTPIDLTNCQFIGQIRKSYYSANSTANFVITTGNAAAGNIGIYLTAATTANIRPGRYLYDIAMTDTNNKVSRVVEGIITINPQVSRT